MMRQTAQAAGAIAALLSIALPAMAQERGRTTPQTDRTVTVSKGTRLSVNNDAGEVVLRTWDRDSLRVQASHSSRVTIDIQTTGNIVSVRSRAANGPAGGVDYEITAPAWLPVKVSGTFLYIGIEGAQNEISAETVRGDIVVKGGSGFITAKSIQGEIIVEDAKGRINVSSVNEGIRIAGAIGDVTAESTNGDIILDKVDAKSLEVTTVNGDIRYEGSIGAGGQYRFATHNGDITMVLPETTNATFTVRTYNGDFQSSLPTKTVGEVRRGRRATYTLGNGGAQVELESFGGTIRLRRPGTGPATRVRDKEKEKVKEKEAER
jgi:Putative adhesin